MLGSKKEVELATIEGSLIVSVFLIIIELASEEDL